MGSTGKTVGTVGGAAIGTALLPGVGTVLGGALGGVVGGLFDSKDDPGAIGQAQYGGGINPESKFAHDEADRVQTQGRAQASAYDKTGQNMFQDETGAGHAALARDQVLGNTAAANGQRLGNNAQFNAGQGEAAAGMQQGRANGYQTQSIGAANNYGGMSADERAQGQSAIARLQGFYQQGPGPSAAEAQLRMGADQNMAQQLAIARSGRGVGGNAAAMRQAMFQNAATGQQTNQQAAVIRANEAANWRQQQLGAMGMEQGALGNMRAQDIGAQGQALGFAGTMGQQGLGYGQLGQGYQQIGNNAQLGFEGMGQAGQLGFEGMGNQTNLGFTNAGNQAALGYSQLGNNANQFGESLRNTILQSQGNFNLAQQQGNLAAQSGQAQNAQRQDAANTSFLGSALGQVGAMSNTPGNRSGGGGSTGYYSSNSDGIQNPWA